MSPPEKLREIASAIIHVVTQAVALFVFFASGAVVFCPDVQQYIHLDPARAQTLFVGLAGYFGVPKLVEHNKKGGSQ